MRLTKQTGFIVYAFPIGEADQIVTSFTSSGNILKFIAMGSRKVKSRFAATVQLFNLGEFVVYSGRGLPYLRQADIIHSFPAIRRNLISNGAAFAVMELCKLLIGEEAGEEEAFRQVLAYMHYLNDHGYSSATFDAFRLKFVASLGYGMTFSNCAICGQAAEGRLAWNQGGLICSGCFPIPNDAKKFNPCQLDTLSSLQELSLAETDNLHLSVSQQQLCAAVVDSLIIWLTEGKTKAQAFRKIFEDGFK